MCKAGYYRSGDSCILCTGMRLNRYQVTLLTVQLIHHVMAPLTNPMTTTPPAVSFSSGYRRSIKKLNFSISSEFRYKVFMSNSEIYIETRIHSSGMRTARLLTVSQHALPPGGTCPGGYLPGSTCLGGVPARGGVPAWGVYLPRRVYLPRGVPAQVLPP